MQMQRKSGLLNSILRRRRKKPRQPSKNALEFSKSKNAYISRRSSDSKNLKDKDSLKSRGYRIKRKRDLY
jgi:hypothetical protein